MPVAEKIIRSRITQYWVLFFLLSSGMLFGQFSTWRGGVELHTIMEVMATLLAVTVGAMALVRYYSKKSTIFLLVGAGFLGTGFLDAFHAIVTSTYFRPMMPSDLPALIPWSWVASRLFLSTFMVLIWYAWLRETRLGSAGRVSEVNIYLGTIVFALSSTLFFVFAPLPRAYYPEFIFHRPEEFLPAALFLIALVGNLYKGNWRNHRFEHWLILSLIVGFVSQAMFMSFSGKLFDFEFDVAHTLKKVSYIFVLTGLLVSMYTVFRREHTVANELAFQKRVLDEHLIISITDVKGDIVYANDHFCKISGYSREELLDQNHRILKSDEHPPDFFQNLWQTISSGRTWRGNIKNKNKSGGFYWSAATIVPFLNDAGKPYQYVAVRIEITAEKEREYQLQEATAEAKAANVAKSNFLAAMSHEIRTPMASVIGMAELLVDSDLSLQQLEWANNVRTSGQNLLEILNGILDQSKLEAGKLTIDPIDFHLSGLVDDITLLFKAKFAEKNLALEIEFDENLPEGVHADRLRVGQILSNFLSNALKFTSDGQIAIRVSQTPQDNGDFVLRFEVTDSGIGLSEEAKGSLFSAFVQADNSTSRTYGGTGLGLSISKQLAELMGGKIGVESTKGVGSTFWFTVACRPATGKVAVTDKRRSLDRWTAARPLNILVAEDTEVIQQLILAIFKKFDHELTLAKNGMEAIEAVRAKDFDLVLMDIRMPVMDGLEATSIIRSMDKGKSNLPIIALTADLTNTNVKEYLNIGINDVCSKPIDLPVLLRTINTILDEEIFTSNPEARSATQDNKALSSGAEWEPAANDTSFSQVLERVSNIEDQFVKLNGKNKGVSFQIEGVDLDNLTELQQMYEERLIEQCEELKTIYKRLEANPLDIKIKEEMKMLTHSLKGSGGTFGYKLVTSVVTEADDLLGVEGSLKDSHINHLKNLVAALLLVSEKRMSGNGGKAGRILLQGLKDFS